MKFLLFNGSVTDYIVRSREHFDAKATAYAYAIEQGVPTVAVNPGLYLTNFHTAMIPQKVRSFRPSIRFPPLRFVRASR